MQQYEEDDLLLVASDTQHHGIRRLSLGESCLKIHLRDVPAFAGCHLATHSKCGSCGSRRIGLLIFLLFVLETSQYPSGLCLEEVTLFVRLDGEHPYTGSIISRLDLPQVGEIKKLVANSGSVLKMFRFNKLVVVSLYFLS